MKITSGVLNVAQKVLLYGVEGVGKTTLAAQFPNPVFIDTEGSTNGMDVRRLPKPSSWTMLYECVDYVIQNPNCCKSLVIDTMDWAEALCNKHICDSSNMNSIEAFGYGKGYIYSSEEMQKFLYKLDDVIDKGINVVLTAHSQIRKFEQPDEMGAYDRYELKLGQKTGSRTAALLREWADMVLFLTYETYVINADDSGKKKKAQGSRRVMYTTHHACWDAKNRHGLDEKLSLNYSEISHIFKEQSFVHKAENTPAVQPISTDKNELDNLIDDEAYAEIENEPGNKSKLPKALLDLMEMHFVEASEIEAVVEEKGVFPKGMPLEDYDIGYINGVIIGAWPQVYEAILKRRESSGGNDMPWENK